jgi:hypothetical protein
VVSRRSIISSRSRASTASASTRCVSFVKRKPPRSGSAVRRICESMVTRSPLMARATRTAVRLRAYGSPRAGRPCSISYVLLCLLRSRSSLGYCDGPGPAASPCPRARGRPSPADAARWVPSLTPPVPAAHHRGRVGPGRLRPPAPLGETTEKERYANRETALMFPIVLRSG